MIGLVEQMVQRHRQRPLIVDVVTRMGVPDYVATLPDFEFGLGPAIRAAQPIAAAIAVGAFDRHAATNAPFRTGTGQVVIRPQLEPRRIASGSCPVRTLFAPSVSIIDGDGRTSTL